MKNIINIIEVSNLSKLCAQIILENGGETYRAEETVSLIGQSLGLETDIIAIPTGIFISVTNNNGQVNTVIKRIRNRTVNLAAIHNVNDVSRKLVKGQLNIQESIERLEQLHNAENHNKFIYILAAAVSSGFFALLLQGTIFDLFAAAFCGIFVHLVFNLIEINDIFNFAISIIGGAIISICSIALTSFFKIGNIDIIIIGAMTPLLPGLAMTTAIRDAMRGDLLSGVARAAEALTVAIALAFGVGAILSIYYGL
ncbi:threonine/serine exporter [Alkalibaculum sp. M08DMB]|uniref:Threonine/serine exporter n=1 Tax=Alkalibaculum sporogenes TaxID=2655001 RepID=A0A6A7K8D7_9FIRM|nr:threonine/serine exporter family protein [Alkalibaculum sporogenes]MPW25694.1 threonine/serine exporter [Alkalibaculum sporogenes]